MSLLPAIEIESCKNPDTCIIWLHGLGATNQDFVPIIPELGLSEKYKMRFIFPQASTIPVTINDHYDMPAWFDILSMKPDGERIIDEKQLKLSASEIQSFIDKEIDRGIASERIIVAGFSQGAAVAYLSALTYPKRLGGLIALSGYIANITSMSYQENQSNLPIFIGHGIDDSVVDISLAKKTFNFLSEMQYGLNFKEYPIEHTVSPDEVRDISAWIQRILA